MKLTLRPYLLLVIFELLFACAHTADNSGQALVSINVTPTNPSVAVGTKQQFTAMGTFKDDSTKDITTSVLWSSSGTTVATINDAGVATAISAGTTTITAALGEITGSTDLTATPSINGATWTQRSSGTSESLSAVVFGNGTFVAVGGSGTILTSQDGVAWTTRNAGTTSRLTITYGNGIFVAVGNAGTIITSTDGITWTSRSSGTTNNLFRIIYGNGLFVAVGGGEVLNEAHDGYYGTIITSTDGSVWTVRLSQAPQVLYDATYGSGKYVVVGSRGIILTSTDGSAWTTAERLSSIDYRSVAYGNGLFVILSASGRDPSVLVLSSTDAVTWNGPSSGVTPAIYGIKYLNA